MLLKPDGFRRR